LNTSVIHAPVTSRQSLSLSTAEVHIDGVYLH
jgi:hypothetical protein